MATKGSGAPKRPGLTTSIGNRRPTTTIPDAKPYEPLKGEKLYQQQISQADKQIKDIKRELLNKKLTPEQRKRIQDRINDVSATRNRAQNNLYQVRGEYEKLLSGSSRDAFMALKTLFTDYGLESLAGKIFDYVQKGYGADTVSILLQDTSEYKKRFAANELRKKQGLPVLSPAQYLSVESSYRQIMRQSGLPKGFYDSNEDFTKFLGVDVSPTELQARVDLATQATVLANPSYREALKKMGLSDGEIAAYFLDPKKALPIIQKTAAKAAIGAEALRQGLNFSSSYTEGLVTQGITREQAKAGYSQIAGELGTMEQLADIYGGSWSQRQAEQALFEGKATAIEKQRRLVSSEKGAFSGSAGGARGGLAQRGGAQ